MSWNVITVLVLTQQIVKWINPTWPLYGWSFKPRVLQYLLSKYRVIKCTRYFILAKNLFKSNLFHPQVPLAELRLSNPPLIFIITLITKGWCGRVRAVIHCGPQICQNHRYWPGERWELGSRTSSNQKENYGWWQSLGVRPVAQGDERAVRPHARPGA